MGKRIQRKRTLGWRMPENTVYVGRPSKFGNPFLTADEYECWLMGTLDIVCKSQIENATLEFRRRWILRHLPELRGKDLSCWCKPDAACHADVLLRLAN
jgi:hypothetical protein